MSYYFRFQVLLLWTEVNFWSLWFLYSSARHYHVPFIVGLSVTCREQMSVWPGECAPWVQQGKHGLNSIWVPRCNYRNEIALWNGFQGSVSWARKQDKKLLTTWGNSIARAHEEKRAAEAYLGLKHLQLTERERSRALAGACWTVNTIKAGEPHMWESPHEAVTMH